MERRRQSGLWRTTINPSLTRHHPIGISGGVGGEQGWSGGGGAASSRGGGQATVVLRPQEARRGWRGVKPWRGVKSQISAVRWNHLTSVNKPIAIGVDIDVVVIVVAIVVGGVAERGAGGAVVGHARAVVTKVGVCGGAAQGGGRVVAVVGEGFTHWGGGHPSAWLGPQGGVPVQIKTHIGPVCVEVVFILEFNEAPCPHGNVGFDLFTGSVHILRHPCHLEHRLFVSAGCHDVGVGLLLDALDGGTLGAYNQPYHTVRHPHLDGGLSGQVRRSGDWGAAPVQAGVFVPGGSDHGEVLGSRDDLPPGHSHILPPACHHKNRLLTSNWGLDVGVGLCSQRFDLATWSMGAKGKDEGRFHSNNSLKCHVLNYYLWTIQNSCWMFIIVSEKASSLRNWVKPPFWRRTNSNHMLHYHEHAAGQKELKKLTSGSVIIPASLTISLTLAAAFILTALGKGEQSYNTL